VQKYDEVSGFVKIDGFKKSTKYGIPKIWHPNSKG
jgi:hypothetical protein